MIQLPYRDGDRMEVGGGNIDTPIENLEQQHNYMEVMVPGRIQPEGTVTTATGTYTTVMKPKRKSYKSELKAMTKERDKWRKAFKFCALFFAGYIAIDILYAIFR